MIPSESKDRTIVTELATFDRLLEVGIGRRPDVARALTNRGCDVIAIDVDDDAIGADGDTIGADDTTAQYDDTATGRVDAGSVRACHGDILALAKSADPMATLPVASDGTGIEAVYGLNLPAELQRPTVETARRLDAACSFTTLGFEEPVVPIRRRSLSDETLYVARETDGLGGSRPTTGPPDR